MTDLQMAFMFSPFSDDVRVIFDKIILKRMSNFQAILSSSQDHYTEIYNRCREQLLDKNTPDPGKPVPLEFLSGVFCLLILGVMVAAQLLMVERACESNQSNFDSHML